MREREREGRKAINKVDRGFVWGNGIFGQTFKSALVEFRLFRWKQKVSLAVEERI